MESNVSPDTIQREISVLKGDVIATVPDPDLGMGEGGGAQFGLKIRGRRPPGPFPSTRLGAKLFSF